jgi:hypothetical protein
MSLASRRRRTDVRVTVDLEGERPDLALVDELARLHLAAKQLGWTLSVREPTGELADLLDLVGLSDVVSVEVGGQPEQWEQRLGVEEVVMPDDPVA